MFFKKDILFHYYEYLAIFSTLISTRTKETNSGNAKLHRILLKKKNRSMFYV